MDFDPNAPVFDRMPHKKGKGLDEGVDEPLERVDAGYGTKEGAAKNQWIKKIKARSAKEGISLKDAMSKPKKSSPWLAHVMEVKAKEGCSLKEAMKLASASWGKEPKVPSQGQRL